MIEPFRVDIPDAVLDDLRRRILSTRWPPHLDDLSWSYGFESETLRELAAFWADGFDWRAEEQRINEFAQYRTVIDGFPIHFIRQPGVGPAPVPLILTHGWPWTFWDMQKVIGPLADPASHGGDAADAFEVVVPSLPGFAFSTPVPRTGLHANKAAELWHVLMRNVLGFERFAAAGADWGARVTAQLGHRYADALYGIHTVNATPLDLFNGERFWDLSSALLPDDMPAAVRTAVLPSMVKGVSHVAVQTVEPQTLAYAMHDSPVGMLAWLVQRRQQWGDLQGGPLEAVFPREHLLATATIYWATESFASAARYYREAVLDPWRPSHDRSPRIEAPAGITFLGGENPPGITTPEQRVATFMNGPHARNYDLVQVKAHARGGHFAHYENPEACVADIRETFRGLRGAGRRAGEGRDAPAIR